MGKKWIYRLNNEDFANVTLDGRLEDMRKVLSEYYSERNKYPQLVDIWADLEATYHDKAGPSFKLTNAEGDNLVASLSVDSLQKEASRRESSQDRKITALISRPSQSDYTRIAKQVRMVVQVRRGGKTVRVPGAGGMVRQHIGVGVRQDSPSDA